MEKPKNYYGSLYDLDENDSRIPKFKEQIESRGFDDTELWNLDKTIVNFIAPRLKAFLEYHSCELEEKAEKDLSFVLKVFSGEASENSFMELSKAKDLNKAWKILAKYIEVLWY